MRTVYFLHGRDSTPHGVKIAALSQVARQHGWQAVAPDFSVTRDPEERVTLLRAALDPTDVQRVLVGSSMGGYVALRAAEQASAATLLLLAPALGLPGYPVEDPHPARVPVRLVHGWSDTVVPVEGVIAYARRHNLPLYLRSADHALHSEIPFLCRLLDELLDELGAAPPVC